MKNRGRSVNLFVLSAHGWLFFSKRALFMPNWKYNLLSAACNKMGCIYIWITFKPDSLGFDRIYQVKPRARALNGRAGLSFKAGQILTL